MQLIRSFLAIEIDENLKKKISDIISILKENSKNNERMKIKWLSFDNIHLTLNFLGSVKADLIDSIINKLPDVISSIKPFSFDINGIGGFPNINRPRVLYLSILDKENNIINLKKLLDCFFENLSFKIEKRQFSPHITIGRINFLKENILINDLQNLCNKNIGNQRVSHLSLFKSELKPSGAVHTILKKFVL